MSKVFFNCDMLYACLYRCNRQVELTEEEAFKGVDDIIMDQQINIHFALKERPWEKGELDCNRHHHY